LSIRKPQILNYLTTSQLSRHGFAAAAASFGLASIYVLLATSLLRSGGDLLRAIFLH